MRQHLDDVQHQHKIALRDGYGGVEMPYALGRKYPAAHVAWEWQYVFPAPRPSRAPLDGTLRRHHLDVSNIQKAMGTALRKAGITRNCGCHTLRHSFATHLLSTGTNVRIVQQLMSHKQISTTESYLHLLERNGHAIESPLDRLL